MTFGHRRLQSRQIRGGILFPAGSGRRDRGHDEKWDQTGKEMAKRHLTHNDAQNFQDGAEGSG